MRLQDMSVLEKADKLEELLNKADLDVDYAITVAWKNNAEEDKTTARIAIENARMMFMETQDIYKDSQIESLDLDVQAEAYATYNTLLDNCLKMFPEYINNDIITESIEPAQHI